MNSATANSGRIFFICLSLLGDSIEIIKGNSSTTRVASNVVKSLRRICWEASILYIECLRIIVPRAAGLGEGSSRYM